MSAVVRLVVSVSDTLNFLSAHYTRLAVAAVNGHFIAKRSHLLRKSITGLGTEPVDPKLEGVLSGNVQPLPFFRSKPVSLRDGRQASGVQYFVGIGVADATNESRVGQSAFEGVIIG
jgi:hypothetical protein